MIQTDTASADISRKAGVACRDGDLLLIQHGSVLSDRCPVCNRPGTTEAVTVCFTKSRHSHRVHPVAALIGRIMDFTSDRLAGDHFTGPVSVQVRWCSIHARQQRRLFAAGWVMLIGGVAGFLLGLRWLDSPLILFPCGLAVMFAFPLVLGQLTGILQLFLRSQRFNDRWVWVKGVCPEFLEGLPEAAECPGELRATTSSI